MLSHSSHCSFHQFNGCALSALALPMGQGWKCVYACNFWTVKMRYLWIPWIKLRFGFQVKKIIIGHTFLPVFTKMWWFDGFLIFKSVLHSQYKPAVKPPKVHSNTLMCQNQTWLINYYCIIWPLKGTAPSKNQFSLINVDVFALKKYYCV